jgi:aspartate racemase
VTIKKLGIIGGVGPLAASHFYNHFIQLTRAACDEEHIPVILVADRIPSRIAHLMGNGPSPLAALSEAARTLESAGADTIVIPSATTHAYHAEIARVVEVPVLDLRRVVGTYLAERKYRDPVFLTTVATAKLRLFDPFLPRPTRDLPAFLQRDVSEFIDRVKRGEELQKLKISFSEWLGRCSSEIGGDCFVLGCTELSVIAPPREKSALPVIDVADLLAKKVLELAELPFQSAIYRGSV